MAVGVERKLAALFLGVEPEQAVELLGLGHVRHHEVEMIERMHAELAGAALTGWAMERIWVMSGCPFDLKIGVAATSANRASPRRR